MRIMQSGQHMTEEQKTHLSVMNKGKPGHPMSPEARARMSTCKKGRLNPHKGQFFTLETRAKMSASQMGHPSPPVTAETRLKISIAKMGHPVSAEVRAMLQAARKGKSPANKGVPMTVEQRAKMSIAQKGRKQSAEMIAHRAAAMMGHATSLETRAKISAAQWRGGPVVASRKAKAKRRLLGFNPLNSPFLGCEGHHINPNDVIYMPKVLHKSIKHNQYTGKGMAQMNALAGQYLTEDWT